MNREGEFEVIAEQAIRDAEQVDCSLDDFADGLGIIVEAIRDRKRLADDEVEQRRKQQQNDEEETSEEDDEEKHNGG